MKMRPFGRLLPWEEALGRLQRAAVPVDREEVIPVPHAVGRVVARAYRSRTAVPPFARATWDGYAFRARSTEGASAACPRHLTVVGEVFAEGGFARPLKPTEAVAVATGGALPPGADAVVRFEDVVVEGQDLCLSAPVRRGAAIASPGEDLAKGSLLVPMGRVLTPPDLGALAITGESEVVVRARPIVAVIPNGNELCVPGRPLRAGQIYESNNATLSGVIEGQGAVALARPPVVDDPDRIESEIRDALRTSDLVLVTGGSSVGERDYLPRVFPRLGRMLFHGIAIRPGKPTLAVSTGSKVVLGLPGHPTSCLSNAYWLLAPVLRRLAGRTAPDWFDVRVRLSRSIDLPTAGLATVIPLEVQGGSGRPTFHDSSAISSLGSANAFSVWPAGRRAPKRGQRLTAHVLLPPTGRWPAPGPDR